MQEDGGGVLRRLKYCCLSLLFYFDFCIGGRKMKRHAFNDQATVMFPSISLSLEHQVSKELVTSLFSVFLQGGV